MWTRPSTRASRSSGWGWRRSPACTRWAKTAAGWLGTGARKFMTPTAWRYTPAAANGSGDRWPTRHSCASTPSPTTIRAASGYCNGTVISITTRTTACSTSAGPACGWNPGATGARAASSWWRSPPWTKPSTTSSRSGTRTSRCAPARKPCSPTGCPGPAGRRGRHWPAAWPPAPASAAWSGRPGNTSAGGSRWTSWAGPSTVWTATWTWCR